MYLPIFNITPVISYTLTDLRFWIIEGFENMNYRSTPSGFEAVARFIHNQVQSFETTLAVKGVLKTVDGNYKLNYSFNVYETGLVRINIYDHAYNHDCLIQLPDDIWNRVRHITLT